MSIEAEKQKVVEWVNDVRSGRVVSESPTSIVTQAVIRVELSSKFLQKPVGLSDVDKTVVSETADGTTLVSFRPGGSVTLTDQELWGIPGFPQVWASLADLTELKLAMREEQSQPGGPVNVPTP